MRKSKTIALAVCAGLFAGSVFALVAKNTPVSAAAENVTTWEMQGGAAVRLADPSGIRFTAQVSAGEYDEYLTDIEEGREVTFGMVIVPYEYEQENAIDETTLFGDETQRKYWWNEENKLDGLKRILHYEVDDLKTVEDGKYLFNCAMTKIDAGNYGRDFYARAYYAVTENGETTYCFTEKNDEQNVRNISYVAQKAIEDGADKTSKNYGKYNNSLATLAKYGIKVGYTLTATEGKLQENTARLACSYYLPIEEIKSVSLNENYQLTWLAYDADKNYLGNGNYDTAGNIFKGSWLGADGAITPVDILTCSDGSDKDYSKAVYFRFAVKKGEDGTETMTATDLEELGLEIVCENALRTATSVDGTAVIGTKDDWTIKTDDDGKTSATNNGVGREIKYFAQTGIAYTIEAEVNLQNNLLDNSDDSSSEGSSEEPEDPWTNAGFVIRGANSTRYAFMMFLKSNQKDYGMYLVNVDEWSVLRWLGDWNLDVNGAPTIKVVNDGMQIELYNGEEVLLTLTSEEYQDVVGKNNAVGLITLDGLATFKNLSVEFQAQCKAEGTVSASDDLGLVYDLDKTVIYAEKANGKTMTIENAVDAEGGFNATIPTDTVKLTFVNEEFLPKTYEITEGDSTEGLEINFDRVAVHASVVENGKTIAGETVWKGVDAYAWSATDASVTSGTNSREVHYFRKTATTFTVETTISGLEGNKHAGIYLRANGVNYIITIMPYSDGDSGTDKVAAFLVADLPDWSEKWSKWSITDAKDSYKLKVVNDGTQITVTVNGVTSSKTITATDCPAIGAECTVGLVAVATNITFSDFSMKEYVAPIDLGMTVMALSTTAGENYGQLVEDTAGVTNRFISTTEYLEIDKVESVSFADSGSAPYKLQWFAYDENGGTVGYTSSYVLSSPFDPSTILDTYSTAVYFRFRLRRADSTTVSLTTDSIAEANVTVTLKKGAYTYIGAPIAITETRLTNTLGYKKLDAALTATYYNQDGAVSGNYVFSYNSNANVCTVYDKTDYTSIGTFALGTNENTLTPHCNSVCFGNEKYAEGDEFPLLYANVYNASGENGTIPGVCNVYRITRDTVTNEFSSELVQVIKIGFTTDSSLWTNGVRPYGNFVVDTDNGKLYCYVMVDETNITRFFEFELPKLEDGEVVTLGTDAITAQFETAYLGYMQGVCYHDGKIFSLEGSPERNFENILRVINPATQKEVSRINLTDIGITQEPEMIYVENGTLYIATIDGALYELCFY